MDGEILQVLRDVASRLETLGGHYMLTGSIALGYYIEPRMTRDIDIVLELDTFDPPKFVRTFEDAYYVPVEIVEASDERGRMFNLIQETFIVKVDFVVRRAGEYRELEFSRRRRAELNGIPCWIVSPEDLVLSKLLWSREARSELQSADVKSLLRLEELDWQYLDRWSDRLGIADQLLELRRA